MAELQYRNQLTHRTPSPDQRSRVQPSIGKHEHCVEQITDGCWTCVINLNDQKSEALSVNCHKHAGHLPL